MKTRRRPAVFQFGEFLQDAQGLFYPLDVGVKHVFQRSAAELSRGSDRRSNVRAGRTAADKRFHPVQTRGKHIGVVPQALERRGKPGVLEDKTADLLADAQPLFEPVDIGVQYAVDAPVYPCG